MSHKNVCRDINRVNSIPTLNETTTTSKSTRKGPEDFEVIVKDHHAELGKGSYGCVKLVRDKETKQLFAMKIVFITPFFKSDE